MNQPNCVSIRLRRITTEVAYISVPITQELLVAQSGDASAFRLDVEKLFETALKLGRETTAHWELEDDIVVMPHPIQEPPPASSSI